MLAGIEGAENILGDIVVHGPDAEIHDQRLHQIKERLQDCGLTLNAEKCLFNMDRLVFMGMLLSETGIEPTEHRVKAVLEAGEPKSATDVRSFLGLANYSSRFISHFATLSEPLRRLTRKEIPFNFGPEQKKSFESLKQKMAEAFRQECTHQDHNRCQPGWLRNGSRAGAGRSVDTSMLCKP